MAINYKKIILTVGFLLGCLLIGYLIYALFFKSTLPSVTTGPQPTAPSLAQLPSAKVGAGGSVSIDAGTGKLPSEKKAAPSETTQTLGQEAAAVAQGGLTKTTLLSSVSSFASTLSDNGADIYFYNRADGQFYRLNGNGQATALSEKKFFNVARVNWAANKQKVIMEYPDGANILYNFQTGQQITLPKHWQDFDFSPRSTEIVAKSIGLNPENNWLIIANEDGSQARAIENLGANYPALYSSWSPNNLSVALFTESIDFNRQRLYFIGQNDENFKTTTIEGRGPEFQWTLSGSRLLYSVYSDATNLNPSLWIVDAQGENIGANRKPLGIQTWAHKCALPSETVAYCAVPVSLPEGAGLFPELGQNTTDNIYKIDLATGSASLAAVPEGAYNIQTIVVSADERQLYFTDSISGNIHKIRLK
ncbi:MAG: hypothetical protein AAB956_02255 [Patescibacteria group bacterium]